MNIFVLGLMAIAAGLLLRELAVLLRARAPAQTRVVMTGENAPLCQADIPRIIWTYWESASPPAFIQACLDNWRRFAPDHEVRLLDRSGIERWLPELRADFDTLPGDRQADWLRAALLARHGGVWMDVSMLLSRDLGWLHETRRRRAADLVGFYADRYTTRPELPIVENWLMASVPGGAFAAALQAAVGRALDEGAAPMMERLQREGRHARVVQALPAELQRDLSLPVIVSDLLDREPQAARLVLLRAEDGPQAWQAALGWRPRHVHARLALLPCPRMLPAVLKLNDAERAIIERNWRRGLVSPFSALAQLIDRPG